MCFFEHFEQTDAEAFTEEKINLDVLQHALEARIKLASEAAEAAFNQALRSPNLSTLALVDREINLLQSMRVDAKCIKNLGRTDSYMRLHVILDDFASARDILAKTTLKLASVKPIPTQSHTRSSSLYSLPKQLYNL